MWMQSVVLFFVLKLCPTHTNPSFVLNEDNADVACDTYHKWKEDIELLKYLGVNHYRFSLSWSRILPTGYANKVNEAGVNYYKNLIKALKENNITPVITLHHMDYPQPLQDIGGWPNPKLADYFGDYARVAFREFGDDVKYWTTFNEPKINCGTSYASGELAPGIKSPGVADYLCSYTIMLAHAKAYHIYDEEFRPTQNGMVSIVLNAEWAEPATNSTEDIEAAERKMQFELGLYANPIYFGNWPRVVIDRVKLRSEGENFPESRLPKFTDEEIEYIKGTNDYFCLNHYFTKLVEDIEEPEFGTPDQNWDEKVTTAFNPSWNSTLEGPMGMRKLLNWIKKMYNDSQILITENGTTDDGTSLEDTDRIQFYEAYISAVLDALLDDEVKVIGYTAWSFMDNFEWSQGYSIHYGLYHVDFKDENRTRNPKQSVDFYKNILATHCLVDTCTSA